MSEWSLYNDRIYVRGNSRRNSALNREKSFLSRRLKDSLSYFDIAIDGINQSVAITNTDNLDTKKIYSMPGQDIRHGGMFDWMDGHWLITERDSNNEVYTKGTVRQCNYLLRWVDPVDKIVCEKWCLIEDGTKYLTGEFGSRDMSVTRGDSRVSLTIQKDLYTLRFNRESRFIIDDYESTSFPLAYRMTKPYKLGGSYDGNGVLRFVLTECNTEDDDNLELHIADYYTYFPKSQNPLVVDNVEADNDGERKVWI